jgi:hypothetical protein
LAKGPLTVTVTGEKEMLAKFQKFAKKFPKSIAASLQKQCEKTMTRSKRDFCPVRDGTLMGTGHVSKVKVTRKSISCVLAYGGPSAPYAEEQHERLDFTHPGKGQAKYLEQPLKEDSGKYMSAIAKDVKL